MEFHISSISQAGPELKYSTYQLFGLLLHEQVTWCDKIERVGAKSLLIYVVISPVGSVTSHWNPYFCPLSCCFWVTTLSVCSPSHLPAPSLDNTHCIVLQGMNGKPYPATQRQCWEHPMNELMPIFLHLPTPEGTEQYDFLDTLAITVVLTTVSWRLTTRRARTGTTISSLKCGTKITVYSPF